jgi:hypothetical protein
MEAIGLTLGLLTFSGIAYTTAQNVWGAPEVVKQLVAELTSLQKTLENVTSIFANDEQPSALSNLNMEIETCLDKLNTKFKSPMKGFRGLIRSGLKRLK